MRPPQPTAMTSLEVLCATALASMLMVAASGFVAGVVKHDKALGRHDPAPRWQVALAAQIDADFRHAHTLTKESNGFRLEGPLGRDAVTGVATWRPGRVTYHLADSSLGSLLFRAQSDPASLALMGEAACIGATRVFVLPAGAGVEEALAATSPLVVGVPAGPLPPSLRVMVLDGGGRRLLDHTVQIR